MHHRDDLCTFDVIIEEYGLKDKALLRMAKVINAANTNRLEADALAFGFEAIVVGYSLRFPKYLENIERQFEVYDALYVWCRLDVPGIKSDCKPFSCNVGVNLGQLIKIGQTGCPDV